MADDDDNDNDDNTSLADEIFSTDDTLADEINLGTNDLDDDNNDDDGQDDEPTTLADQIVG